MMTSSKGIICLAALALLAFVYHAAMGSDASDVDATALAISVDANGDDTASIPDFDGDGTIGFGDFVIFAGVFGARESDEKYEAKYDLNGDGEIGFSGLRDLCAELWEGGDLPGRHDPRRQPACGDRVCPGQGHRRADHSG